MKYGKKFWVYKVEKSQSSKNHEIQLHGRAMKLLKLKQPVYLTNDHYLHGEIVKIVSYGQSFDEIEPMMGCSITIRFADDIPIHENIEWLYG